MSDTGTRSGAERNASQANIIPNELQTSEVSFADSQSFSGALADLVTEHGSLGVSRDVHRCTVIGSPPARLACLSPPTVRCRQAVRRYPSIRLPNIAIGM